MWGVFEAMKDGGALGFFAEKDFSPTGAARTMALDVKHWLRDFLQTSLIDIPDNFKPIFHR